MSALMLTLAAFCKYNPVCTSGGSLRITWDEDKNRANKAKHNVCFETAQHVFSDPLHISVQDRHEGGEDRWQTIGMVAGILLLLVAHTWIIEDEEEIRIISARKATAHERKRYEKGTD